MGITLSRLAILFDWLFLLFPAVVWAVEEEMFNAFNG